jgi:Ca2+-dependent lipid-binding protein
VKPSTTSVSTTVVDNKNTLDNNNLLDTFSTTSLLHENERKEEQVELLSDRKILEMESTILKTRRKKVEDFTDRLVNLPLLHLLLLRYISHAFILYTYIHTYIHTYILYTLIHTCIHVHTCMLAYIRTYTHA